MNSQLVYYRQLDSPIGPLLVTATDLGLCSIEFGAFAEVKEDLGKWCGRWMNTFRLEESSAVLEQAAIQLRQYFAGNRREFDVKLDLRGTLFQKRVWQALLHIPYGQTRSYKEIGLEIGAAKAVRAIGGANHHNPLPIIVPCHRVIGSNGSLVGYGGGLSIKSFLLELESDKAG